MSELLYKELSYAVVGAAMEVHKVLGAAFLESVYQRALAYELTIRNIPFEEQKRLDVQYKGQTVGEYKADFVVDDKIILEIKAASAIVSEHESQALNYLAAAGYRLAIILNFGTTSLQYRRIVK